jgi:PAS domain S-box-containing protein
MVKFSFDLFAAVSGSSPLDAGTWAGAPTWLLRLTATVTGVACLALLVGLVMVRRRWLLPFPRTMWLFGGVLVVLGCIHLLEAAGWAPATNPGTLLLMLGNALAAWITLLGLGVIVLKASISQPPGERPSQTPAGKPAAEPNSVSEERFRLLVDYLKDYAIFMLDLDGRVASWNEGAQHILGYRAAEIIGQPCFCFHPKEDQSNDQARKALQVAATEGRIEEEGWRLRQDGSRFWAQVIVTALKDEEGRLCGFTQVTRDITTRQHLKEQLYQAQKMEAVGRLAGGVAHDFNNLLTVITGYTELLLSGLPAEDPMVNTLQEILKAGQRATGLTHQLLAFSRRQLLAPRVLDLNAIVADMEKMLRRLIGEDIELRTVLDPNLGRVHADAGQLSQVIMNLAVNARDAMPRGGQLLIQTMHGEIDPSYGEAPAGVVPGSYVVLAVTDTGCGMDETIQTHLFEPFFTTKAPGKGTGLGLATVYGIIKQSGGHIEVASTLGKGTTFKLYLPRFEEAPPAQPLPPESAPARHGSETILLVEDETAVRNLLRMVLSKKGYKVLEATNGRHALHVAGQHPGTLDLLVTDVVMPLMGGQELVQKLAPLRPQMKVLFMSGYTDSNLVRSGVSTGEIVLIQKPFSPDQLVEKVREILDGAALVGAGR